MTLKLSLKRALPSILAGLSTPFALGLVFAGLLGAKLLNLPRPVGVAVLIASFLFVLAVSLCEPILPLIYGPSVFVGFLGVGCFLGLTSSDNIIGLVVIVLVVYGFLLGISASLIGLALRQMGALRWWLPAGLIVFVVVFSLVANAWLLWTQHQHTRRIAAVVEEIRRAELAYAAAQPERDFTCNGPDLPGLRNIEWRANENLGLQQKSQTYLEDYWLTLNCDAAVHPRWVEIAAGSWWGHRLQLHVTE